MAFEDTTKIAPPSGDPMDEEVTPSIISGSLSPSVSGNLFRYVPMVLHLTPFTKII